MNILREKHISLKRDMLLASLGMFFLFALSLLLRLITYQQNTADGIRLMTPDCYAHLRRSLETLSNFPHVPVYDSMAFPPEGAYWIWPPFYDLFLAFGSLIFFGKDATLEQAIVLYSWIPPILGALQVIMIYQLGTILMDQSRAMLIATSYAIIPAGIITSAFGNSDQHVMEVVLLLALLIALASPFQKRSDIFRGVVSGSVLALSILNWQGAVFLAGIVLPWQIWVRGKEGLVAGLTAAGIAFLTVLFCFQDTKAPFSVIAFGWFQPVFIACVTGIVSLAKLFRIKDSRERWFFGIAVLGILIACLPWSREIFSGIQGGLAILSKNKYSENGRFENGVYILLPSTWLVTISEYRPLIKSFSFKELLNSLQLLGPGLFALPVMVVIWWRDRTINDKSRDALRVFSILSVIVLFMAISERRYAYYLSVFCAFSFGDLVVRSMETFSNKQIFSGIVVATTVIAASSANYINMMRNYPEAFPRSLEALLKNAAETFPNVPSGKSEGEAVFSPWQYGHYITALWSRPAAADPFGFGWERQCRLYSTVYADEVKTLLKKAGAKFLLTTPKESYRKYCGKVIGQNQLELNMTAFVDRIHFSGQKEPMPFLELVYETSDKIYNEEGNEAAAFRLWRVY